VSLQLWQTIAATAAAEMLPIHSHVAQSIEEFQRIRERHACTPVELLEKNGVLSADAKMLLVHSMFLSQSDLNKLDPEKHVLGLCPASAVQFGFPCNYPAWRANGLQVALGTDAACSNDNMDVQGELRLLAGGGVFGVWSSQESAEFLEGGSDAQAAGVQAVRQVSSSSYHMHVSSSSYDTQAVRQALLRASSEWNKPGELLKTVTSVPGSLHPALPVGAIRSGALANLLFVRLDHPNMWPSLAPLRGVCFSSLAPAIDGLMVAGKWVGQRGNFHQSVVRSERYERHRQEADRRFADLLVRAGIR
jgi:cytosine/adenosine deaminase-related metal-dependent hydrolase